MDNAVLATINHMEDPEKRAGMIFQPIHIEKNVWIGANATILKGVEIGEGSIVSAETLVTNRVGNQIIICNEKRNFVLHENITWHR